MKQGHTGAKQMDENKRYGLQTYCKNCFSQKCPTSSATVSTELHTAVQLVLWWELQMLNQDLHLVSLKTETVAPPTGHYIPKLTKNK